MVHERVALYAMKQKLTWLIVHLWPSVEMLLRPMISTIAASKSGIPWPVTAHVYTSRLTAQPGVDGHSQKADGAQSILLMARITGELDPDALCIIT